MAFTYKFELQDAGPGDARLAWDLQLAFRGMILRDDPRFKQLVEQVETLADAMKVDAFPIIEEISYVFQERLLTDEERGRARASDAPPSP
jgi:hypothetical protein